jgi:hypothetical protein
VRHLLYARAITLAIIIDTLSQFCRFASFSCIITTQLHMHRQIVVSKRQIFLYTHAGVIALARAYDLHAQP